VLGPWANTRALNLFTGAVIAALVILSVILTVAVLFPEATSDSVILGILGGGAAISAVVAVAILALGRKREPAVAASVSRDAWRMPALDRLPPAQLSLAAKAWMGTLRLYLVVAVGLVVFRIVMLALQN